MFCSKFSFTIFLLMFFLLFFKVFTNILKIYKLPNIYNKTGITKPCTHVKPAPSTSTQLHPALFTSTKPISTSTQLHPPPLSSFQLPPSSLQHPKHYRTKILQAIGQFHQIWADKFEVVHFEWKLAHIVSWRCSF